MKRFLVVHALLIAIVVAPWAVALADAPAALLLSCAGTVTVVRADHTTVAGSYGLPLEPGDEIRTGPGSSAEIHFRNGTWLTVGAGSNLVVKGTGREAPARKPAAGEESFASVQSFLKLKDAEGVSTLAALRSMDMTPEIRLVSPSRTTVRGGRLVFRWEAADSASELLLTLYDGAGVRWKTDVRGTTSAAYTAEAAPLAAGTTYSWTLETADPLRIPPLRTPAAFFEVLPAAREAELDAALAALAADRPPSEAAGHTVRASLFFAYRLLDDAIAETRLAIAADPGNASLRTILARLYAETGRSAEAMNEYDRLIERR